MRVNLTKCYNCICNACTKFRCPYPHKRCRICTTLEFKRIYDCDYFENRHTAPRRYRIKRKGKHSTDALNAKLDYLIASLGLIEPVLESAGTYAVLYDGMELFRGSKNESVTYISKMRNAFSKPLKLKKVEIKL